MTQILTYYRTKVCGVARCYPVDELGKALLVFTGGNTFSSRIWKFARVAGWEMVEVPAPTDRPPQRRWRYQVRDTPSDTRVPLGPLRSEHQTYLNAHAICEAHQDVWERTSKGLRKVGGNCLDHTWYRDPLDVVKP